MKEEMQEHMRGRVAGNGFGALRGRKAMVAANAGKIWSEQGRTWPIGMDV